MRTPPRLQKGDLIALASPARSISRTELQTAVDIIEKRGYRLRIDREATAVHHQFAGNDHIRTSHFQKLLDQPEVKAILCTRGGYGSLRIIDKLDFSAFRRRPKWIAGYSDITVIHARLQHLGVESLHATMPVNFESNTAGALQSLFDCLEGKKPEHTAPPHTFNRSGQAQGQLVGGNLSILYSLKGSFIFPKTKENILLIEDLDEYLYHIDRMMLSLKRAGIFDGLAGLVVGGMTDMNDNQIPYGQTAEEIIREHVAEYDFPVCYGFPSGHIADNRALTLGKQTELIVDENGASLR